MNRINRITAILIQLQSRKVVRAQDIAGRFGISLRTVYRDIRMLEEAGVPIISEAGVGYSIMDGYRLPPVMFTREEATAFLTAEKLIEKLTDTTTAEHYASAMFKIKAVLRSAEKDMLEHLDRHIYVAPRLPVAEQLPASDVMQTVIQSILGKKVLLLHYVAQYNGAASQREVEPVGMSFMDRHWHLIAFCRMRNDYRDFRLDRIVRLQLTDLDCMDRALTLDGYVQRKSRSEQVTKSVVLFDRSVMQYIGEQKYYYGFVSETDRGDKVEITFLTTTCEGLARWLLMFCPSITVVSPPELLDKMQYLVRELNRHLL